MKSLLRNTTTPRAASTGNGRKTPPAARPDAANAKPGLANGTLKAFSGAKLRSLREGAGLTRLQLAAKVGVTNVWLYYLEQNYARRGKSAPSRQPTLDLACRLADALGCRVDDLLGRAESILEKK